MCLSATEIQQGTTRRGRWRVASCRVAQDIDQQYGFTTGIQKVGQCDSIPPTHPATIRPMNLTPSHTHNTSNVQYKLVELYLLVKIAHIHARMHARTHTHTTHTHTTHTCLYTLESLCHAHWDPSCSLQAEASQHWRDLSGLPNGGQCYLCGQCYEAGTPSCWPSR